jgi:hypothetical protein
VLQTAAVLTTGTYFTNASALMNVDASDFGDYCFITPTSQASIPDGQYGGSDVAGKWMTAAITDYFFVDAGDSFELICYSDLGDANTYVNSASLTAVLIGGSEVEALVKPRHEVVHSGKQGAPE